MNPKISPKVQRIKKYESTESEFPDLKDLIAKGSPQIASRIVEIIPVISISPLPCLQFPKF